MLLHQELNWPEAWKPLLRALDEAGWWPEAELDAPDWAVRPILRLRNELGHCCHLAFFREPIWCGNSRQQAGLTIAGLSREYPESRAAAEQTTLLLTTDWESQVEEWIGTLAVHPFET